MHMGGFKLHACSFLFVFFLSEDEYTRRPWACCPTHSPRSETSFCFGWGGDRGVAQLFGAPRAEQLVPGLGRCPRSQPTNHNSQTVRHASFRLTDLEALAQVSNEACVRGSPRCIGACQDRRSDRQSRSNGQFVATCH